MLETFKRKRGLAVFVMVVGCCAAQCRSRSPDAPAVSPLQPTTGAAMATSPVSAPNTPNSLQLSRAEATAVLCNLYEERDLDCDQRITRLDEIARCGEPSCAKQPSPLAGSGVRLDALHHASQLATELADGLLSSSASAVEIDMERVLADPVSYLVHRIQHRYWDALTRTIDPRSDDLWQALRDEKQGHAGELGPNWCGKRAARCAASSPAQAEVGSPSGSDAHYHLYVPAGDDKALKLYGSAVQDSAAGHVERLKLGRVPHPVPAQWVTDLTRRQAHGLLTLAYDDELNAKPFVVPGGRFNEMYGWDSFFITWGLVEDVNLNAAVLDSSAHAHSRIELARSMVEHQEYQILHYGKVLNANRTYYLTRSQPPFVAPLLRMVASATQNDETHSGGLEKSEWVDRMLHAAIREYEQVWAAPPRRTALCDGAVCLARYYGEGHGQPPEVEEGHFAAMYQRHAVEHGHCPDPDGTEDSLRALHRCASKLERAYASGKLVDSELDAYFVHDRCMRESGHDTTFRWFSKGQERCADHATIDLNALLFRYETDIAQTYSELAEAGRAKEWCERARARQRLVQRYLWDEEGGLFFDYDMVRKKRTPYLSATTLYPLWASKENVCGVRLLSPLQARRLVDASVERLEAAGGLMATDPASLAQVTTPTVIKQQDGAFLSVPVPRQWEAPNGWAPHQMLAWYGLRQHGFEEVAQRLAYRWLHMIASNSAQYHGTVPEKFDVVERSHRVFAEYGNVNAEFSYIAREGFGWVNASVLVGLNVLSPEQRARLRDLEPPEAVFSPLKSQ